MKKAVTMAVGVFFSLHLFAGGFIRAGFFFDISNPPREQAANIISDQVSIGKMTPILYVKAIEPCLPFWADALGFQKTAEVTEKESLGFVIMNAGEVEVMLQTYASLEKDIPRIVGDLRGAPSVLYFEVGDIADVERRLTGFEVVVPRRTTFYGALEVYYRSPGGHIIGFAQHSR